MYSRMRRQNIRQRMRIWNYVRFICGIPMYIFETYSNEKKGE